jgi:hypothetical protein
MLSMMILNNGCCAQVDSSTNEPAQITSQPNKVEWLSTLSQHDRSFLSESHQSTTITYHGAETQPAQNRNSRFSSLLKSAWKKGFVERGIEASIEALIQCQKEQSPALTIPFMRSDSQQLHCFRF